VDKATQYREHAKECRRLAGQASAGEHYAQLLQLAETWEKLADDRDRMLDRPFGLTKHLRAGRRTR
jgi:hypothetical protein